MILHPVTVEPVNATVQVISKILKIDRARYLCQHLDEQRVQHPRQPPKMALCSERRVEIYILALAEALP